MLWSSISGMNRIPPPLYVVAGLYLEQTLTQYMPLYRFDGYTMTLIGFTLIGLSVILAFSSAGIFLSKGTTVIPHHTPNAFVRIGPYKHTRNPMYLGMLGILIGSALVQGSVSSILVPIVFIFLMDTFVIRAEEKNMLEQFGESYVEYMKNVRRWI